MKLVTCDAGDSQCRKSVGVASRVRCGVGMNVRGFLCLQQSFKHHIVKFQHFVCVCIVHLFSSGLVPGFFIVLCPVYQSRFEECLFLAFQKRPENQQKGWQNKDISAVRVTEYSTKWGDPKTSC